MDIVLIRQQRTGIDNMIAIDHNQASPRINFIVAKIESINNLITKLTAINEGLKLDADIPFKIDIQREVCNLTRDKKNDAMSFVFTQFNGDSDIKLQHYESEKKLIEMIDFLKKVKIYEEMQLANETLDNSLIGVINLWEVNIHVESDSEIITRRKLLFSTPTSANDYLTSRKEFHTRSGDGDTTVTYEAPGELELFSESAQKTTSFHVMPIEVFK